MPGLPALVTITGYFVDSSNQPGQGFVKFTPVATRQSASNNIIMPAMVIGCQVVNGVMYGADGAPGVNLVPVDDTSMEPLNTAYFVEEEFHHARRTYYISPLTVDGPTIDLADLPKAHLATSPVYAAYVKTSDLAGLMNAAYDVQIFPAAGLWEWTKPDGAVAVEVIAVGAGGGGGAGCKGATTVTRLSGAGGGGGGYAQRWLEASILGDTEPVTVGAGGVAGAATSVNDGNGGDGGNGGNSFLGTLPTTYGLTARGGVGGLGGYGASGGLGGAGGLALFSGGNGANGTGGTGNDGSRGAAGGGGSGGGINASNTPGMGGSGGASSSFGTPPLNGGAVGGSGTGPAVGYYDVNQLPAGGAGGGGGGSSIVGNGGNGGPGGVYGGGAGGGGSVVNGAGISSGAGGVGGAGFVIVRAICFQLLIDTIYGGDAFSTFPPIEGGGA